MKITMIKENCGDQITCLQANEVKLVYYITVFNIGILFIRLLFSLRKKSSHVFMGKERKAVYCRRQGGASLKTFGKLWCSRSRGYVPGLSGLSSTLGQCHNRCSRGLVQKAALTSWGIFETPFGEILVRFQHVSPDDTEY